MNCPRRSTAIRSSAAVALLLLVALPARAAEQDPSSWQEIETKYVFGFTEGSGIGLEGEKEVSVDVSGRFGKRDGHYSATETKFEFETTPNQFIQVEFGALGATHSIGGVTGFDDRHAVSFAGLFAELRYLVLERGPSSPFSVTAAIEQTWRRIDETTGERVTNLETEMTLAADTQLVENRVYLGFNLFYEPEWTWADMEPLERESTIGVSAALAFRLMENFLLGGEIDYLRHYDGAALEAFTGDAVYIGPTLYWQITPKTFAAAAFGVQVTGRDVEVPGSLNLSEFSRYRAKFKVGVEL
jgi:hypothetical protein